VLAYALKRLLLAVPGLLVVAALVFTLVRMIPGDPAQVLVGDLQDARALAQAREALGLDRPFLVQFALWLERVLQGDLGRAIVDGESVLPTLLRRFFVTAQFTTVALALGACLAVPAGLLAAWRQGGAADALVVATAILLMSIPSFWIGLMLILVFGVGLGWLPVVGYVSVAEDFGRGLSYLVLPVAALALGEVSTIARMMRSSALEVLRLEYVVHARAKGLRERTVLWRHVFRNAFAPTLTFIGLVLGGLLGGAAVTETVFGIPGLGRYLVDAIYARDYPAIQGCLLFVAVVYTAVNLAIDLVYPLLDPRVRL
jgi:peptide/nickel transport system permease protein